MFCYVIVFIDAKLMKNKHLLLKAIAIVLGIFLVVGLLVLFRVNNHQKENLRILGILYGFSVILVILRTKVVHFIEKTRNFA